MNNPTTPSQGDERRAINDALALLNATQEALAKAVAAHPQRDSDCVSMLLGLHDSAKGYGVRKALATLSAAQPVAQEAIPAGYALISIDALRAWGKLDEVRDACKYPLAAPPPSQGAEPDWYRSEVLRAGDEGYAQGLIDGAASHHPASAEAGKGVAGEAVGALTISKFRGHLENQDFDYFGTLPEGTHKLYVHPSESVSVSGEVSEEQIDAVWDSLPSVKIHNDATSRGLKTEVLLRRYFARAVLALAGSGGKA